jgi:hypothetical protein
MISVYVFETYIMLFYLYCYIASSLSILWDISLAFALVASMLSRSNFIFFSIKFYFYNTSFWFSRESHRDFLSFSSFSIILLLPSRMLIFYSKMSLIRDKSPTLSSKAHLSLVSPSISKVFCSDLTSYLSKPSDIFASYSSSLSNRP